jgi:NAD(P) transhydrogenase
MLSVKLLSKSKVSRSTKLGRNNVIKKRNFSMNNSCKSTKKLIKEIKKIQKRFYSTTTKDNTTTTPKTSTTPQSDLKTIPFGQLTIGVPREIQENEMRVAMTPENVAKLTKQGFKIVVERGAGTGAKFSDSDYESAGAKIVSTSTEVFQSDIIIKVRPPQMNTRTGVHETDIMKEGSRVYSFIYPAINKDLVGRLEKKKVTAFGMDCIPRISRAQVYDVLSSMASISGYKAVIEAASHFGRYFTGQITAAGRIPPTKILVIGAGVAGLSAIATAKGMGAIVRAFDTRPAAKEQVESLGAEFLTITSKEDGTGVGGYAKEMSKEYHDAEIALFHKQCKEVDIIITTALIPGKKAPVLISKDMVDNMKDGSVIVDLASEAGGNVEVTKHGEVYKYKGVTVVGLSDFPSRMATQSSTLWSNNVTKFLQSMCNKDGYVVNLADEVVRGSMITQEGVLMWPPPPLEPSPVKPKASEVAIKKVEESTFTRVFKNALYTSVGMGVLLAIGVHAPPEFTVAFTTLSLATAVGYYTVWGVQPALHSPLMSVTNAISGLVAVGGLVLMGGGYLPNSIATSLAATATFIAMINVFGGFLITKRMLDMFKRPTDPPEYTYLYGIPGLVFLAGFAVAARSGSLGVEQVGYLASSLCCLMALAGLSSQSTARVGNAFGIVGVTTGLLSTLSYLEVPHAVYAQIALLVAAGATIGLSISSKVAITSLPQLVALFHSFVGLAAVITAFASYLVEYSHFASDPMGVIHMISIFFGTFIGGVTFTGSLVAFGKLDED